MRWVGARTSRGRVRSDRRAEDGRRRADLVADATERHVGEAGAADRLQIAAHRSERQDLARRAAARVGDDRRALAGVSLAQLMLGRTGLHVEPPSPLLNGFGLSK